MLPFLPQSMGNQWKMGVSPIAETLFKHRNMFHWTIMAKRVPFHGLTSTFHSFRVIFHHDYGGERGPAYDTNKTFFSQVLVQRYRFGQGNVVISFTGPRDSDKNDVRKVYRDTYIICKFNTLCNIYVISTTQHFSIRLRLFSHSVAAHMLISTPWLEWFYPPKSDGTVRTSPFLKTMLGWLIGWLTHLF